MSRISIDNVTLTPNRRSTRAIDALESVLREATLDVTGLFSHAADQVADVWGQDWGATGYAPVYQDRRPGDSIPAYRDERTLKAYRDRSRVLCYFNEFALCAVENRVNYIVGDGFRYVAQPREESSAARDAATKVQELLDIWQEINDLPELEAEAAHRADEDGEYIIRRFPDRNGIDRLRFVEPELLTGSGVRTSEGTSGRASFLDYGVKTSATDTETIEAYRIVENPDIDPNPIEIDPFDVVHAKFNVKRNARRGLPTLFPVEQNLRRAEDLLASMSHMAKVRAKIALIRRLTGVSGTAAQQLVDQLTKIRGTDASTNDTINLEKLRYGSVLTIGGNQEIISPAPSLGASDLIEVLQAELRAVASRLQMPEWMLTALADAKYSNAFIVEAPTLRAFRKLQSRHRKFFGVGRFGSKMSLAWRQVRAAAKLDLIPADAAKLVKIDCIGPTLEARDKSSEASTYAMLIDKKLISRATAIKELGRDSEKELEAIEAESPGSARPVADALSLMQVQTSYYSGQLPKPAAIALCVLSLGFEQQDAEKLFPGEPTAPPASAAGSDPSAILGDTGEDDPPPGAPSSPITPGTPGQAVPMSASAVMAAVRESYSDYTITDETDVQLREIVNPAGAPKQRFTGRVVARNGAVYYYIDGKRVAQKNAHQVHGGKAQAYNATAIQAKNTIQNLHTMVTNGHVLTLKQRTFVAQYLSVVPKNVLRKMANDFKQQDHSALKNGTVDAVKGILPMPAAVANLLGAKGDLPFDAPGNATRDLSQAASQDSIPEEKFTGTDALGREWMNGVLVAKKEDAPAAKVNKQDALALAIGRGMDAKHFGDDKKAKAALNNSGYPAHPNDKLAGLTAQQRIEKRATQEYQDEVKAWGDGASKHKAKLLAASIGAKIDTPGGSVGTVVEWGFDSAGGDAPVIQLADGSKSKVNIAELTAGKYKIPAATAPAFTAEQIKAHVDGLDPVEKSNFGIAMEKAKKTLSATFVNAKTQEYNTLDEQQKLVAPLLASARAAVAGSDIRKAAVAAGALKWYEGALGNYQQRMEQDAAKTAKAAAKQAASESAANDTAMKLESLAAKFRAGKYDEKALASELDSTLKKHPGGIEEWNTLRATLGMEPSDVKSVSDVLSFVKKQAADGANPALQAVLRTMGGNFDAYTLKALKAKLGEAEYNAALATVGIEAKDTKDTIKQKVKIAQDNIELGFTGRDALGREWINGELVAKVEEPAAAKPAATVDAPKVSGGFDVDMPGDTFTPAPAVAPSTPTPAISELYFKTGGTPKFKAAIKTIEQGPASYVSKMSPADAMTELNKVINVHAPTLMMLANVKDGKAEIPEDTLEYGQWQAAQAKAGKVISGAQWAENIGIPAKEMYIKGLVDTKNAIQLIDKKANSKKPKNDDDETPAPQQPAMQPAPPTGTIDTEPHFTPTGKTYDPAKPTDAFKKSHPHAGTLGMGDDGKPNPVLPNETRPAIADKQTALYMNNYSWGYDGDLNRALRATGKPPEGDYGGSSAGKKPISGPGVFNALQGQFAAAKPFGPPPKIVKRGMTIGDPAKQGAFLGAARAAMASGKPARMPGFISTTTASGNSFDGNFNLVIEAVHGLDMKPYSHFGNEDELLLNHNSRFIVTKIDSGAKGHTIHLKQLPPDNTTAPVAILSAEQV